MTRRRDLVMGLACLAGAAAAYQLRPRTQVTLLGDAKLADIIPRSFGPWDSEDAGDPMAVNGPGTLSAKLYNQLLVRVYRNTETGDQLLALLAYGGRQTDELQLHRPEVCYPAFGFSLTTNEPVDVPLGPGVTLPARRLMAENDGRLESVVYWSRMGEFLPRDGSEQRGDRLRVAMQGIIPDGLLCRFSAPPPETGGAWSGILSFLPAFVVAIPPEFRKVLVGTERAQALAGIPSSTT